MKITVLTSNQPRHFRLIDKLCNIADHVYAIQECTTLFPGKRVDYYPRTPIMEAYFSRVLAAEKKVFGNIQFPPDNCTQLPLFLGDVNYLPLSTFKAALDSDYFVIFGASYIKGELVDTLISKCAINIHMGASPYYRGNSCNFWAIHDGRADYVSGTIHMITKGLDSGPILYHALPKPQDIDPFELGMRSVDVAQNSVCHHIQAGTLFASDPVTQDRSLELRYTKNVEFHDVVAESYLKNTPTPEEIGRILVRRDLSKFVHPYVE
jgi:hypothetical protein